MKYFIIAAIFIAFLPSCKKLLDADLDKSRIEDVQVFANDITATSAMTGIYNSISMGSPFDGGTESFNTLSSLSANELINNLGNENYLQFQDRDLSSTNSNLNALYSGIYSLVYQCNAVYEGVNASTSLTQKVKDQLMGEARFMRGFCYFYLTNMFGDVPLITKTDYRINQNIGRTPTAEVYSLIKDDLLEAQALLTNEYVSSDRVRPNKAAVTALLARVYLYLNDYANAEAQASMVIDNGEYIPVNPGELNSVFQSISTETIWQIMTTPPNEHTRQGLIFVPPSLDNVPDYNLTDALAGSFESGDTRKTEWVSTFTNPSGTFSTSFKYKLREKTESDPFNEYSIVLRLPEMFLIRAEARAHLNNIAGAQDDLNAIRTRADLTNTAATDQPSLLLAVEQERSSELFTEWGHRWFDLKRTGRSLTVIGNGITESDLLYPIPQDEFIKNPNLGDQNAGY